MDFLRRILALVTLTLIIQGSFGQSENENKIISAFQASYTLEKEGEYSEAANKLKAVYQEDSYELNLRLGWLSYLAGLFSESIGYYNKAILLKPYSIEPRLGVVLPESSVGNWQVVINEYNKILKIDPSNTLVNYRLGSIYYGRNEYEEAKSYFEKVVNLYPFDHDSLLMLAWTNLRLQKTREAKVLFVKVLMYNPNDESAKEGLSLLN